jgi:hypothetical protein
MRPACQLQWVVLLGAVINITPAPALAGGHSQTGAITSDVGRLYEGAADSTGRTTEFRRIEAGAFGTLWPLKAGAVYIGCVPGEGNTTTIIVSDGVPLAATIAAREATKARDFQLDINGKRIDVVSAIEPRDWTLENPEFKGLTKNLTPLSEVGSRIGCLSKGAMIVE